MKRLYVHVCMLFLLLGLAEIALAQNSTQQTRPSLYARVRIVTDREGLARLERLGIAVDHGYYRPDAYLISELSEQEIQKVREAGYSCEVLIPDLVTYYQERAANYFEQLRNGSLPAETHRQDESCNSNVAELNYPIPTDFELGSMGGYFTYEEALAHLDNLANRYPDYVSAKMPIDTFLTHEQRPIYWLRVSDNPNSNEIEEPEVMMTAVHHAREPGGLSQMIFFLYYLLENKDNNPEFQFLLDNTELYLVPIINPDGYIYNQTMNPNGGGFWRKNKRDNNNNGAFSENNDGVDLNRNYGEHWGYDNEGSSPDPAAETYRGPAGFSEPETQAMKWFCEQHHFQIALNYHTYSNLLIYPWGHIPSYYTPDSALFTNMARVMTQENRYTYGTGDQTVGYVTNGDSDDWMYGEQTSKEKILSMTPEVGTIEDGFWASPDRIVIQCKENVWQNLHLLRFVHHYATLNVNVPDFVNDIQVSVPFDIRRLGLKDNGTFTVSIEPLDNIDEVSPPITFNNLDLLESRTDSLWYMLFTDFSGNISYNVVLDNHEGLILKYFVEQSIDIPNTIYTNACNNMTAFDNSNWAATIDEYYSAPASITDSPFGNYSTDVQNNLLLNEPIDLTNLTNVASVQLTFWAKWDIENNYDYVQLNAYNPATGVYTPLCGKYTNPGVNLPQPVGQPIYDGKQNEWVKETIDLSDLLGQVIQLEWTLISDGFVEGDGFYFDDIEVYSTTSIVGIDAPIAMDMGMAAQPNPATNEVNISYELPHQTNQATLYLTNAVGQTVLTQSINAQQNQLKLPIQQLPNGVYTYRIQTPQTVSKAQQLVIQH